MQKKFYIGYKSIDKPPLTRNILIKKVETSEETDKVIDLYMQTFGEQKFLEENDWYEVKKMNNLIAIDGNEFLGCATWEKQEGRLFLLAILTVPKYFREGIGTKLLNKIKEIAQEQSLSTIFVPISNDDLVSYVFYHKNGFKLSGIDIGLPEKRHGKEETGFWDLPCRDEFYLEYKI